MALEKVAGRTEEHLDEIVARALRAQLLAGVTTVRDLGDRRFNVVGRRDRQRSGAAVEPTIVASGPPITSPGDTAISSAVRCRAGRTLFVPSPRARSTRSTSSR